jgi:hypothetical protein
MKREECDVGVRLLECSGVFFCSLSANMPFLNSMIEEHKYEIRGIKGDALRLALTALS